MISLYVAIPFLIAMIVLYFWFWYFDESEDPEKHCDVPRVVGIVRKPYDDDREIELLCTGLIVSSNVVLTLGACLPSGKDVIHGSDSDYIVTSGSKYWSKLCNKNQVIDFKEINEFGTLTIDGEFTACLRADALHPTKDASTYSVKGWKYSHRKMYDPITEMDLSPTDIEKACDILGAPIFSGNNIYGLVKKKCTVTGEPVIVISNFLDALKQNIPQSDFD